MTNLEQNRPKLTRCPMCKAKFRANTSGPPGTHLECSECKYRLRISAAPPTTPAERIQPVKRIKPTQFAPEQIPITPIILPSSDLITNPAHTVSKFKSIKPVRTVKPDPYAKLTALEMPGFFPAACGLMALAAVSGYALHHAMGPEFALFFWITGAFTVLVAAMVRQCWHDYWGIRALGCIFIETLAVARFVTSDHPGEHHYGFLVLGMMLAPMLLFMRTDVPGSASGGSCSSSCSSGCGGGGCGGGGCGG